MILFFFQNEGIFVHSDGLEELDKITHARIRIHLQSYTGTEITLVYWSEWLPAI